MPFDSLQERTDLTRAPAFVPPRKARAQVQAKHTRLAARRNDLEKRMARARGIMPLVIGDFLAAEKTDRMIPARRPERITRRGRDAFNDFGMRGFLKDDEIGRCRFYRFRQRL